MITFLILAAFLSGFIDSAVGGGGLISLPALLVAGLPLPQALGTNKFAGSFSSLTSTVNFIKSRQVDLALSARLFPLAFAGSLAGSFMVTVIPPDFLRPVVAVLLIIITLYTALRKGAEGREGGLKRNHLRIAGPFVFGIGFYDGFLGPGTGSFLAFLFLYIGYDFVKSAGCSRMMNFGSNIAALLLFAWLGHVNYYYGAVMALSMMAGSWLGSTVAIRTGQRYIKPLFILVSCSLVLKLTYDWLISS